MTLTKRYTDFLGLPGTLDRVQEMVGEKWGHSTIVHQLLFHQYPDKFILFTEACTGSYPWELQKVAQLAKYQQNRKRKWCQMLQLDNDD